VKSTLTTAFVAAVVSFGLGWWFGSHSSIRSATQAAVSRAPVSSTSVASAKQKLTLPKAPDALELKIWAKQQELMADESLEKAVKKESAKDSGISEQMLREQKVMAKLLEAFPEASYEGVSASLERVSRFKGRLVSYYYALTEKEVRRLQRLGEFSVAKESLIHKNAYQQVAKEYRSLNKTVLKQMLGIREDKS